MNMLLVADEETSEFAAGALNTLCSLPGMLGGYDALARKRIASRHIMRALRADYAWLLDVESRGQEVSEVRINWHAEPSVSRSFSIDNIRMSFDSSLIPRSPLRYSAVRPCDADTSDLQGRVFGDPSLCELLLSSTAVFVFTASREDEVLLLGWHSQLPTLHGLFSYVPAIATLVIDAYITEQSQPLNSGLRTATVTLVHDAKVAIGKWAAEHSDPGGPILVAHGRAWTPTEIAREVDADTDLGMELYLDLIRQGVEAALGTSITEGG